MPVAAEAVPLHGIAEGRPARSVAVVVDPLNFVAATASDSAAVAVAWLVVAVYS